MGIDEDKAIAAEWWAAVGSRVTPAAGLWFGVVDVVRDGVVRPELYVAGCSEFDPQDESFEWAVDPQWMHPDGYVHLPGLVDHRGDPTAQLEHAAEVVRSLGPERMGATGGVAVGFDDGDGTLLWAAPRRRTRKSPGWYRLWIGRQSAGGRVDLSHKVPDLEAACDTGAPFDEVTAAAGADPVTFHIVDGAPSDGLWVFRNHALMSVKARDAVDAVCTGLDAVAWLPVFARDEDGVDHPYFLMHVPVVDAIDMAETRFMPSPPNFISALRLDPAAVAGRHLLRLTDSSATVICSGALKDALRAADCSGFSFEREMTS